MGTDTKFRTAKPLFLENDTGEMVSVPFFNSLLEWISRGCCVR